MWWYDMINYEGELYNLPYVRFLISSELKRRKDNIKIMKISKKRSRFFMELPPCHRFPEIFDMSDKELKRELKKIDEILLISKGDIND